MVDFLNFNTKLSIDLGYSPPPEEGESGKDIPRAALEFFLHAPIFTSARIFTYFYDSIYCKFVVKKSVIWKHIRKRKFKITVYSF